MPKNTGDSNVLLEPEMSAHVASTSTHTNHVTSELYDSGATRHMTPYKEALANYSVIMPKPINAANQHTFHAIGQGDLPICVPNGKAFTNITLRDVLHTPEIVFTLVSVGLIDEAGYTVTFKGSTCTICDASHKMVGCFPKREGLYWVDTNHAESASISLTDASLSMTNAHRRLGHISPDTVRQL